MRRVVVTGMGMITAIGCGVQDNWKKLISSTSGIKLIDSFKTDDLPSRIGGTISDKLIDNNFSDKEKRKMDKFILYSLIAAEEAIKNSGWIINDDKIEAVVISTPVSTHFDFAKKCLDAGKHILVEKPIATTIDEVSVLSDLAETKGLVAMVGHTFLYNSAVRYVKRLIDSGELGDIRYIYSQRLNLGRIRSDVDALWNFSPHDISIIQYWLDNPNPTSIERSGMAYVQDCIDDVVFMNIKYPKNILVNIHVSWLDPHKVRCMTVVGSKKMVVYDDIAEHKVTIYDKGIDRMAVLGEHMDFDNSGTENFNYRSGDPVWPKIQWEEPLKVEIEHYINCIMYGTQCLSGVDQARKVISILNAG